MQTNKREKVMHVMSRLVGKTRDAHSPITKPKIAIRIYVDTYSSMCITRLRQSWSIHAFSVAVTSFSAASAFCRSLSLKLFSAPTAGVLTPEDPARERTLVTSGLSQSPNAEMKGQCQTKP